MFKICCNSILLLHAETHTEATAAEAEATATATSPLPLPAPPYHTFRNRMLFALSNKNEIVWVVEFHFIK